MANAKAAPCQLADQSKRARHQVGTQPMPVQLVPKLCNNCGNGTLVQSIETLRSRRDEIDEVAVEIDGAIHGVWTKNGWHAGRPKRSPWG